MADKKYVFLNDIHPNMVKDKSYEKDGETKSFKSVGIAPVPYDFSRSGVANITLPPTWKLNDDKFNEGKLSLGLPEDFKLNVSVATYYNEEDKSKNKYETVEMTAKELTEKVKEAQEKIKAAEKDKEEDDGPELG